MKRKLIINKSGKLEEYTAPFTFFDGLISSFWLPDVVVSNVSYSYPSDSPLIIETLIDVSIK